MECFDARKSQRPDSHQRGGSWRGLLALGREYPTCPRPSHLGFKRSHPTSPPLARRPPTHPGTHVEISNDGCRRRLARCALGTSPEGPDHHDRQNGFFDLPPFSRAKTPGHFSLKEIPAGAESSWVFVQEIKATPRGSGERICPRAHSHAPSQGESKS